MKTIKEKNINISDIADKIRKGKTIVYPTETCYGLGCNATDQNSVDQIFSIKKRQRDKTVLVLMSDITMAQKYVVWNKKLQDLASKYWPGALTLVAKVKPETDLAKNGVIADDNTIAFRISPHPFVQKVMKKVSKPIVSTSANISSKKSPYSIKEVKNMFKNTKNQPNILIDGGELPHESPSTILKIVDGKQEVIRQGELIIE
jgi:L-threonylcarbamoyladenylate synthase